MTDPIIPASTLDVIRDSTFRRVGPFRWVRAARVGDPARHLLVMRDERETTVVTREADLEDLDVLELNADTWELLAIDCASPFYCVGFVARISAALTAAGLDILFTSTFSRDWVFVKQTQAEHASEVLGSIGMKPIA